MEGADKILLLVDGEIVLLARLHVADFAQDSAQFLLRILQLFHVNDLDLHFKVGIVPDAGQELLHGNDDLVVEAELAQEISLFLQHANDLERLLTDSDFVAQRRLVLKQVGGDFGANHANRPATLGLFRAQETSLHHRRAAGELKLLGRADDGDAAGIAVFIFDGTARIHEGSNRPRQRHLLLQFTHLLQGDVPAIPHFQPLLV